MPVNSSVVLADETAAPSRSARPVHAVRFAPDFEFVPRRLAYRRAAGVPQLKDDELLLWRFRPEWQSIPKDAAYACLSKAELARVRSHPNPALAKRFVVGRAVMREILADMIGCAPGEVELKDDEDGQPRLVHAGVREPIEIAIAYAGIWIVVGVSSNPLGLATSVPTLPDNALGGASSESVLTRRMPSLRPVETRSVVRHASLASAAGAAVLSVDAPVLRHDASPFFVDTAGPRRWQILDLPMPGIICAAAAVARPVTRVHAFGWVGRDGRAVAS
jgi:hypothetical protein